MPIVTIDFETAYNSEYSLRKLSTIEYILHPSFEIIGAAVKVSDAPSSWHVGKAEVLHRLRQIDWSRHSMLSHNTRFDGAIKAWHLGITPAMYLDTLAMARATTHSVTGKSSLDAVATYLGLGKKGDTVRNMMGKWLRDFTPAELAEYGRYCCNDNDLCYAIFMRMMEKGFPSGELPVIDMATRMYIQPQVELDAGELQAHLHDVITEKERAFATVAHIDKAVFSSNQQFAALLRSVGANVPMKLSPTTGELIPALARGDRAFKEMLDDDALPSNVQALLACRVNAKSTIEETRTAKTLSTARLRWPDGSVGRLPVPLRYYGAHTGRFSGDDGYNWQNVRRDSRIRKAVRAPKGKVLVTRDASQIEARMVAWLAGQWDLVLAFKNGEDVYSSFASAIYSRSINKRDHPRERFVGKTGILGLGYGCGAEKFRHMLFIGSGGMSEKVEIQRAQDIVKTYRTKYRSIPALWARAGGWLEHMLTASVGYVEGPKVARRDEVERVAPIGPVIMGAACLWLPNGMPISYYGLRQEPLPDGTFEMVYGPPSRPAKRIYGAKMVENVSQALARIVITDIMKRVWKTSHLKPVLQVHDSLIYCVDEKDGPAFDKYLEQEFAVRPYWGRELPLASEGGVGHTLAEAEGK